MDAIRFPCTGCGKTIRASGALAGHTRKCPGCGASFVVPNQEVPSGSEITANSNDSPRGKVGPSPSGQAAAQNAGGSRGSNLGSLTLVLLMIAGFLTYWSSDYFGASASADHGAFIQRQTVPALPARSGATPTDQRTEFIDTTMRLFQQNRFGEVIPRIDQLIQVAQDDKSKATWYVWRANAEMGAKSGGFIQDMQMAVRLDPENKEAIEFATPWYWLEIYVGLGKSLMKSNQPGAAEWAEAAKAIRGLDQQAVDPDAIEGGRILASICDRNASSAEQVENGDALLRLLAGSLQGDAWGAVGRQEL